MLYTLYFITLKFHLLKCIVFTHQQVHIFRHYFFSHFVDSDLYMHKYYMTVIPCTGNVAPRHDSGYETKDSFLTSFLFLCIASTRRPSGGTTSTVWVSSGRVQSSLRWRGKELMRPTRPQPMERGVGNICRMVRMEALSKQSNIVASDCRRWRKQI